MFYRLSKRQIASIKRGKVIRLALPIPASEPDPIHPRAYAGARLANCADLIQDAQRQWVSVAIPHEQHAATDLVHILGPLIGEGRSVDLSYRIDAIVCTLHAHYLTPTPDDLSRIQWPARVTVDGEHWIPPEPL